jgi:serine/threonine protein kinase
MQPERFGNSLILIEKIATGGMGEVFKAKQVGTQGFEKTVAVKRVLPHFAAREDFSKLFQQEMWLAAKLQHSNIAQVFSNGEFADYLYLVMEYVQGKTLAEIVSLCSLRKEFFDVSHCCYIISEAAKGLHYAHKLRNEETGAPLNIVHRDVTPQNIMCSGNGEVKVLDFGIAKVMDHISELSRIGDVKGKMQYVSPEQLEGKRASAQSDVFSLGVTMFELLTLRPLFLDESPYLTINNVLTMEVPPLVKFRGDAPPGLDAILRKALAKNPDERYRNAEDFHLALTQHLNQNFHTYSSTELGRAVQTLAQTDISPSKQPSQETVRFALNGESKRRLPGSSKLRNFFSRQRGVRILGSVIIGATIGLAYLWSQPPPPSRGGYLAAAPVAKFVADDITPSPDGKISTWPGESQLGSMAFQQITDQHKPILVPNAIGGHAAVKFDGSQFMTSLSLAQSYTHTSQATFIVVARINPDHIGYLFSLHQADHNQDVFRLGTDDSTHFRVKTTENPAVRMFLTTESKYPSDFVIISVSLDTGAIQIHLNGSLLVPGTLPQPISFAKSSVMTLGMEYDMGVPSDFFIGEMAEILFFDSCLNEFYRNLLEESLAAKYGIKRAK